jgi:hypothetical protein
MVTGSLTVLSPVFWGFWKLDEEDSKQKWKHT